MDTLTIQTHANEGRSPDVGSGDGFGSSGAVACNFQIAATAHGCAQVGVDHWQDWKRTKVFSGAATIAMLDLWAKEAMGPKAAWNDLILSPVEPNTAVSQSATSADPRKASQPSGG